MGSNPWGSRRVAGGVTHATVPVVRSRTPILLRPTIDTPVITMARPGSLWWSQLPTGARPTTTLDREGRVASCRSRHPDTGTFPRTARTGSPPARSSTRSGASSHRPHHRRAPLDLVLDAALAIHQSRSGTLLDDGQRGLVKHFALTQPVPLWGSAARARHDRGDGLVRRRLATCLRSRRALATSAKPQPCSAPSSPPSGEPAQVPPRTPPPNRTGRGLVPPQCRPCSSTTQASFSPASRTSQPTWVRPCGYSATQPNSPPSTRA